MKNDPIVTEVRKHRAAILESFDWDFEKMANDVMDRQWRSGHKVVSRKKRKPEQGTEGNTASRAP